MQQLSFEVLLNSSVPAEAELRLSQQVERMYGLFVHHHRFGVPVSNAELMQIGCQYNARLYELRRALIPCGWCIDLVRKTESGVNYYGLVRLEQSQFYAEHKDRL